MLNFKSPRSSGKLIPVTTTFEVSDYDLAATLNSGQAFRWNKFGDEFVGVIGHDVVHLRQPHKDAPIQARFTNAPALRLYLQLDFDLASAIATFPNDPPMQAAVRACRGLRLLRQDHWETLASFILSSTKQIVQIRQIVDQLCRCYGEPLNDGYFSFPTAERLATLTEANLRSCKMGFRAPYLLETAKLIASGQINLAAIQQLPLNEARSKLCELPGVGEKIANCVLLFAYDFPTAFPIDVWVEKALRVYFRKPRAKRNRLEKLAGAHFGPHAGLAQQYLFHYMRVANKLPAANETKAG